MQNGTPRLCSTPLVSWLLGVLLTVWLCLWLWPCVCVCCCGCVTMSRSAKAREQTEAADIAAERWHSAEDAMTKMMGRVKADFVSRSHVAQMEKLYEESISRLTARVDQLEADNKAHAAAAAAGRPVPRARRTSDPRSDPDQVAARRTTSRERLVSLPAGARVNRPGARPTPSLPHHQQHPQHQLPAAGRGPPRRRGSYGQQGAAEGGSYRRGSGSMGDGDGGGGVDGVDSESAALLSSLMSFNKPTSNRRAPTSVLARGGHGGSNDRPRGSRAPGALLAGGAPSSRQARGPAVRFQAMDQRHSGRGLR